MASCSCSSSSCILIFMIIILCTCSSSSAGEDDKVVTNDYDSTPQGECDEKSNKQRDTYLSSMLSDPHEAFTLFKERFGRKYTTQVEDHYRFMIFKSNLRRAMIYHKNDRCVDHGVTKYSDLTKKEFFHLFLGGLTKYRQNHRLIINDTAPILPTMDLPGEYDWRFRDHFKYDSTSVINTTQLVVPVRADEDQIKANLVKYGPVAVGFDASYLQTYRVGVSCPNTCSKKPNHGAIIIGYGTSTPYFPGTDPNMPYWTIRNTNLSGDIEDNTDTIEDYQICRGNNVCGVDSMVSTIRAALPT